MTLAVSEALSNTKTKPNLDMILAVADGKIKPVLLQKEEEADSVDIEGDTYEEYEWCGETRIRTTTLLPGGLGASGFQTAAKATSDEEDFDLDVDGNDEDHFGQPQYPFSPPPAPS